MKIRSGTDDSHPPFCKSRGCVLIDRRSRGCVTYRMGLFAFFDIMRSYDNGDVFLISYFD